MTAAGQFQRIISAPPDGDLRLPVGRYRLVFRPRVETAWPGFAGSAWRGTLGHALKRLVCVTRDGKCEHCLLLQSCVYPYVFETPPPPDTEKMRRYTAAPHPFVLSAPWGFSGRGSYSLGLTLFGTGNRYLAYIVHALRGAAREGLRGAPPMDLAEVLQEDPPGGGEWRDIYDAGEERLTPAVAVAPAAPPAPSQFEIEFRTPLRLRQDNGYVGAESFQFSDLFRNLLRRISMLTYFHTDAPLETDFAGLVAASREVAWTAADLRWRDWTRYSSRQGTRMQMGGLVGRATVAATDLSPFWTYLWLGQWTHAGKGTSMGLGEYAVRATSPQACDGRFADGNAGEWKT